MKNIFKTNKRSIIAILTLCIFLCAAGIGVHAYMLEEDTVTTEELTVVVEETTLSTEENRVATEETTVVTEESTVATAETIPELVPVMASECCNHTYTNTSYSGGTCPTCSKSVSGTEIRCSKCGAGWVNLTCGHSFSLKN